MFVDNSLSFNTSWQAPQAITASAASTTVVDITGAGSGNAPAMIGGYPATNNAIGVDIGQGDGMAIPYVVMNVTTAFVTANGGVLTIALQAAPDNGSYSPGTYTTLFQSLAFTAAQLAQGQTLMFQVPPRALSGQPGEALPRFYRLNYTVGTGVFSAGAVNAGIVLNPPNGLVSTLYPNNYVSF